MSNTFAEIDSIKNIKGFCQKKLVTGIDELQKILDDVENALNLMETDDQTYNIRKCHEQILTIVNQYFEDLEVRYRQQLESDPKQNRLNQLLENLRNNLNELEYLNANIEGQNALHSITRICSMDLKRLIEKFRKEWKQIEAAAKIGNVNCIVDERQLGSLMQALQSYAYIQPIQQKQFLQPVSAIEPKSQYNQYQQSSQQYPPVQPQQQSYILQQQYPPQQLTPIIQQQQVQSVFYQQDQAQQMNDNTFLQKNVFFSANCQNQVLHFFQAGDRTIWLYDLNKQNPQWQKLELDMEIPAFSKSIISPEGRIYLTGGSTPQLTKSPFIYYLDFTRRTMVEESRLLVPRSSHSIIWTSEGIVVVGGYVEGQKPIQMCELYDPKAGYSMKLPPLLRAVASPGLCSFVANQMKAIVKCGGINDQCKIQNTIEILDVRKKNNWEEIRITSGELKYKSMCCCQQIKNNEIIVFGGYNEKNDGSKECIGIEINGVEGIVKNTYSDLPVAEGFWNNSPVIHQGYVYSLINAIDDNGDTCLENERRILRFDGQQWIELK